MTIDAYKTLYDSSVTFGVKKQLQAEQGMAEMEEQVSQNRLQLAVYRGKHIVFAKIVHKEGWRRRTIRMLVETCRH